MEHDPKTQNRSPEGQKNGRNPSECTEPLSYAHGSNIQIGHMGTGMVRHTRLKNHTHTEENERGNDNRNKHFGKTNLHWENKT